MPFSIALLLEETAISAVARRTLVIGDALAERGHRVRIVTAALPITWRSSTAEWVYLDSLTQYEPRADEFVVATSGNIVEAARRIAGNLAVAWPMQQPIVDTPFFRPLAPRERDPLRVLLAGASQDERKGIEDGYGAVAHARWFHQKVELVRISPWAPSREEPLDQVQEFHVALTAEEMTRAVHSCDVILVPTRSGEMTLTAAEALASRLPALMTSIPAHTSIAATGEFALFGPPENPVELGERLIEVLSEPALRERLRDAARDVAEPWRAERAAARIEEVLSGATKNVTPSHVPTPSPC